MMQAGGAGAGHSARSGGQLPPYAAADAGRGLVRVRVALPGLVGLVRGPRAVACNLHWTRYGSSGSAGAGGLLHAAAGGERPAPW